MRSKVSFNNDKYVLPASFRYLLESIQDVAEVPHFQMPYPYIFINELTGAMQNEK